MTNGVDLPKPKFIAGERLAFSGDVVARETRPCFRGSYWQVHLEPAALCAAGSVYVRKRPRGGARFFPCSSRGLMLRGSDVEISFL